MNSKFKLMIASSVFLLIGCNTESISSTNSEQDDLEAVETDRSHLN